MPNNTTYNMYVTARVLTRYPMDNMYMHDVCDAYKHASGLV